MRLVGPQRCALQTKSRQFTRLTDFSPTSRAADTPDSLVSNTNDNGGTTTCSNNGVEVKTEEQSKRPRLWLSGIQQLVLCAF